MADGRTVPVSTKVSPAVADAIESARGEMTRSAWLAMVAEAAAGGAPVAATPTVKPDRQAAPAPEPQVTPDSQPEVESPAPECAHPKAEWVNRGYGTFCHAELPDGSRCNKKMR